MTNSLYIPAPDRNRIYCVARVTAIDARTHLPYDFTIGANNVIVYNWCREHDATYQVLEWSNSRNDVRQKAQVAW